MNKTRINLFIVGSGLSCVLQVLEGEGGDTVFWLDVKTINRRPFVRECQLRVLL